MESAKNRWQKRCTFLLVPPPAHPIPPPPPSFASERKMATAEGDAAQGGALDSTSEYVESKEAKEAMEVRTRNKTSTSADFCAKKYLSPFSPKQKVKSVKNAHARSMCVFNTPLSLHPSPRRCCCGL